LNRLGLLLLCLCGCARGFAVPPPPVVAIPIAPAVTGNDKVRVEGQLIQSDGKLAILVTLRNDSAEPVMVSLSGPTGRNTWILSYLLIGTAMGTGGGSPGGAPVDCRTPSPSYTLVIPPGGAVGRREELSTAPASDLQKVQVEVRIERYRSWGCAPVTFIEKAFSFRTHD
jgi:hypothetical protein